jgi:CHAT domain-containing protein
VEIKGEKVSDLAQVFADIARLPDKASRTKFLVRHRYLFRPEVVEQMAEAVVRQFARVDTRQAFGLADAAVAIAIKIGNKESLARGFRAKANAVALMGQNQAAAELHAQALKLFQELGNDTEVGRTLSASIQPLILVGEYDRALEAAERAREIFSRQGDAVRLARLDINVGNIYHRQDRFVEAVACHERAYQQLLPDKDVEGIAAALHNQMICWISMNDYPKALGTYQRAREFCVRHAMPLAVAQADYNIAYLHYLRGEYNRSIEMLRATREACLKIGDAYHVALCYLDLAEIYLELNLSEEATETAQEAHVRFEKLSMGYEAAKALTYLAISHSQQEKVFRALELFAKARTIFVREQNKVWPSLIDLYQAVVLFKEGRYTESRRLATAALQFFRSSMLPTKAVLCRLLLARLSLKTEDREAAHDECSTALDQLRGLGATLLTHQAHLLMGEIEEAAGHRARAFKSYQAARQAFEMLQSNLRGEDLKIAFIKNRLEVYEHLVRLCLERSVEGAAAEEAFGYMEQAKSRVLRDLIFRRPQPLPLGDSGQSELVRHIRDLREELNWYYHRIELEQLRPSERSPGRIEQLQAAARDRENELVRSLRELPPSEAESTGLEAPAFTSLEAVRRALTPDSVLVEYFRIGERIISALVTREHVEIVPLTLVSRVRNLTRLLQFQLAKFRLGPQYSRAFQKPLLEATEAHLQEMYQEVFAPLGPRLEGRHLVLVPHDVLHYWPFHALLDGKRPLIESFSVSYAPSATIFALCHAKSAKAQGGSLILGLPTPQAPYILDEVQSVAAILPESELFLGAGASRATLQERGPRSRVVHVATHGYFRQDNPMFSGIRLGDSYLNLYDLYQLRLPVELVTLSGCATGLNVVTSGDELLGLVRGLLSAGAQTLLLTLWDVHDRSTAEFMKSFYRRFREHGHTARALQGAMLELREQCPHPYYWAPFILVGKALPA